MGWNGACSLKKLTEHIPYVLYQLSEGAKSEKDVSMSETAGDKSKQSHS